MVLVRYNYDNIRYNVGIYQIYYSQQSSMCVVQVRYVCGIHQVCMWYISGMYVVYIRYVCGIDQIYL